MQVGVLYLAWLQDDNIAVMKRLVKNIYSLRKFCDLPITVRVNAEGLEWLKKIPFENVHLEEISLINTKKLKFKTKLKTFTNLPYYITIFCDTDTVFYDSPEKIIDEKVDLSICRQQDWIGYRENRKPKVDKHINTGFFIAKNSKPFKNLIKKAWEKSEEHENNKTSEECYGDGRFINLVLDYSFDLTIKILPQQWNVDEVIINEIEDIKLIHSKNMDLNPIC